MAFLLLLLALLSASFAETHSLNFNQETYLQLSPASELSFSEWPGTWSYNTLALQVSSTDGQELAGSLVCEGREYFLTSWSLKIVHPADGSKSISCSYGHTESRSMKITWWVENSQWPSSSSMALSSSNASSSSAQILSSSSAIFSSASVFDQALDLGPNNHLTHFTGGSTLWKIQDFPEWTYNVLRVKIEPEDQKELEGILLVGSTRIPLKGWSKIITLQARSNRSALGKLVIPQTRKMNIQWWAENRTPESAVISESQTSLPDGSIRVDYAFSNTHLVSKDLTLDLYPADFEDGLVPKVTRFAHRPVNVPEVPSQYISGPLYNIHAYLRSGKTVQFALPIPEKFRFKNIPIEAHKMLHLNEVSGQWEEVLPDSVGADYIYFTASGFSLWTSAVDWTVDGAKWTGGKIKDGAEWVVKDAIPAVIDGLSDVVKGIWDGLTALCNILDVGSWANLIMPDGISQLGNLFSWMDVLHEGDMGWIQSSSYFNQRSSTVKTMLEDKRNLLKTLAQHENGDGESATYSSKKKSAKRIEWSVINAEALLADRLLEQIYSIPRRYSIQSDAESSVEFTLPVSEITVTDHLGGDKNFSDLFQLSSGWFERSIDVKEVAKSCGDAITLADEIEDSYKHVKDFFGDLKYVFTDASLEESCREVFGLVEDLVEIIPVFDLSRCMSATKDMDYFSDFDQYMKVKDDILNYSGELIANLTALLYIDEGARSYLSPHIASFSKQYKVTLWIWEKAYRDNNIITKGMASVATWEVLFEDSKTSFNKVNEYLESGFGAEGGYPEGMGYLQFINADLPMLFNILIYSGKINLTKISERYKKSGEWLVKLSRPVGGGAWVPVEVDDGVTFSRDFSFYSRRTGNSEFAEISSRNQMPLVSPLALFGIPNMHYTARPSMLANYEDPYFADGAGIIRAVLPATSTANPDTLSMTIIAEKGHMLSEGYGHDQQDNTSVTLASSNTGWIIRDRGYGGFGERNEGSFAHYNHHNVLLVAGEVDGGDKVNDKLDYSYVDDVLDDWNVNGDFLRFVLGYWVDDISPDDGYASRSRGQLYDRFYSTSAFPNTYGLTVTHQLSSGVVNTRSIFRHDDHFFVIDRPNLPWEMEVQWNSVKNAANLDFTVDGEPRISIRSPKDDPVNVLQNAPMSVIGFANKWKNAVTSTSPIYTVQYPFANTSTPFQKEYCKNGHCLSRTVNGNIEKLIIAHVNGERVRVVSSNNTIPNCYTNGIVIMNQQGVIRALDGTCTTSTGQVLARRGLNPEIEDGKIVLRDEDGNIQGVIGQDVGNTGNPLTHLPILLDQ